MSDVSQGPGWWQASDGKWYPPEQQPGPVTATPTTGPPTGPPMGYGAPGNFPQGGFAPGGYPQHGQAPYGPPGFGSGLPSVAGLATASMVLGIVGVVLFLCFPVGLICGLVGLPLAGVAMSRISQGQADPSPKGQAVAGLTLSIIAVALSVLWWTALNDASNGIWVWN